MLPWNLRRVIRRVYPPDLVTLYSVLKLLHMLSAIWLAGGLLGRAMVLAAARRGPDIRIVKAIADVSGRLENAMVAPGYLAVLVTGIATAVVGGLPLLDRSTAGRCGSSFRSFCSPVRSSSRRSFSARIGDGARHSPRRQGQARSPMACGSTSSVVRCFGDTDLTSHSLDSSLC